MHSLLAEIEEKLLDSAFPHMKWLFTFAWLYPL